MAEFHWIPQDAGGADLEPRGPFSTQQEAEDWMGAEWGALRASGAEFVKLVGPDGAVLYRMGLSES